jgi:hypothetical protein
MTTIVPIGTFTQDPDATVGRGINFAGQLASTAPLGADSLQSATWSVYSGNGTVTGAVLSGTISAALFKAGTSGTITIYKCVAPTVNGQILVEYIKITAR